MTNDQRVQEIVRLKNFQAGLQKQVVHYTELIKQLLSEHCIVEAKYKVGSIVTYEAPGDYGRGTAKYTKKILSVECRVADDYTTQIIYRLGKISGNTEYADEVKEEKIIKVEGLPVAIGEEA